MGLFGGPKKVASTAAMVALTAGVTAYVVWKWMRSQEVTFSYCLYVCMYV